MALLFFYFVPCCLVASIVISVREVWRLGHAKDHSKPFQPLSFLQACAGAVATSLVALLSFALTNFFLGDNDGWPLLALVLYSLRGVDTFSAVIAIVLTIALPFGLTFGYRRRHPHRDSQTPRTVENLAWSWRTFVRAFSVAVAMAIVVFAVASLMRKPAASLWDANGHHIAMLDLGEAWTGSITFNRDGNRFLTVSNDYRKVLLWDSENGRAVATLPGTRPVLEIGGDFSPDGRLIAGIRVWKSIDGALLPGFGNSGVAQTVFSHDGNRLAVREGSDGTLRDARTGSILSHFTMNNYLDQRVLQFDRAGDRFVVVNGEKNLELPGALSMEGGLQYLGRILKGGPKGLLSVPTARRS